MPWLLNESESKTCRKCGVEKTLSNFLYTKRRDDVMYHVGTCRECEQAYQSEYSSTNVGKISQKNKNWSEANAEKKKAYHRDYYRARVEADPEAMRLVGRKSVLSKYGLTPEEYDRMVEDQEGKCAVCGREPGSTNGVDRHNLVVDHDHQKGAVRELLCDFCNRGLGIFRDDPDLLIAAAMYLLKHSAQEEGG